MSSTRDNLSATAHSSHFDVLISDQESEVSSEEEVPVKKSEEQAHIQAPSPSKAIPISKNSGKSDDIGSGADEWLPVRRNKISSSIGKESGSWKSNSQHLNSNGGNRQSHCQQSQGHYSQQHNSNHATGISPINHSMGNSSAHQGHGQYQKSRRNVPNPVMPKDIRKDTALELYGFPPTHRTSHLRQFLSPFDHKYRLKWQNDSSCWVIFDDPNDLIKGLEELKGDEAIKIRPFDPQNMMLTNETPTKDINDNIQTQD